MLIIRSNAKALRWMGLIIAVALVLGAGRETAHLHADWQNAYASANVKSISADHTNKQLRFFMVGDTGTGGDSQRVVAQAMENRCEQFGVDGLVFLGDLFYGRGVSSSPTYRIGTVRASCG
jgi:hypothetical protein